MFTRPSMFGPPSMFRAPGMFTGEAAAATGVESEWCLGFDGTNDTVDCGTPAVMSSSMAFSISMWLYQDDSSNALRGIMQYGAINASSFSCATYIGILYVELVKDWVWGSLSSWFTYAPAFQWNHLCIVYDGSHATNATRLKVYVNGSAMTLAFNGTIPSITRNWAADGPLKLGVYGTYAFWKGRQDDVRICNRALSSTEVTALYENTSPTTDGLVAYIPMEEGTGSTTAIKDGTGSTIGTATISGATWSSDVPPALA